VKRALGPAPLVCFVALLGGCRESPRERPEVLATPVAVARDSATFAGRMVGELSALREGITLAQWLNAHRDDSITRFTYAEATESGEHWCVRAIRRDSLVDAAPGVRYAYFYPPPVPVSLELPPDDVAPDLVAACLLGAIWVQTPNPDSASGRRLAERTREALAGVYGKVTAGPDSFLGRSLTDSQKQGLARLPGYETMSLGIGFFGSAAWRAPGRWQQGDVTVVSAFDAAFFEVRRQRVLAFAFLPRAQLETSQAVRETLAATTPQRDTALEAAARLTQLDTNAVRDFLALAQRQVADSVRIAAIGKWLAPAADLDSAQRAAALFVVDGVVPEQLDGNDSVTREAYGKLGLEFVHSPLAGSYNYAHTLIEEALRLDPNGPTGDLATIELLNRGFDLTGTCRGGFEEVIRAGEPFLGRVAAPGAKAHVLFLLADAYADIVALAAGIAADYVDPADFMARAADARRQAIAYYRQGLALDRTSAKARAAWPEAWRLLAGLPPRRTHFFCVYD